MKTSILTYINAATSVAQINAYADNEAPVRGIVKKTSYINYTNQSVHVLERSGLQWTVTNVPNRYAQQFIIRTEYWIPESCYLEVLTLLTKEIDPLIFPDLAVIKDCFLVRDKESPGQSKPLCLVTDTIIEQQSLINSTLLYVNNQDIALTLHHPTSEFCHPFSQIGLLKTRHEELTQRRGISFSIELIDNENTCTTRYCFLANQLFKIEPIMDETRASGVYFTTSNCTAIEPVLKTIQYTLIEAETQLGLYRTQEEALTAGDLKAARQEELARLTYENGLSRIELQKTQQAYKLDLDRNKAELSQKETEYALRLGEMESKIKEQDRLNKLAEQQFIRERQLADQEMEALKAHYATRKLEQEDKFTERSYERKDKYEVVKTVGVVAASVLSIVAIFLKLK